MATVAFEPFPEPPFNSNKKQFGHMAMAVLMIKTLYKNLPPRRDPLWQESWDTLRGWVAGINFFTDAMGGTVQKQYQALKDAILGDQGEVAFELALELSQNSAIEDLEKKPALFKEALKTALRFFAVEEKKIEWIGFLDSLRVSVSLGQPYDSGWAALDTAYRNYFFESGAHSKVAAALNALLQVL